MVLLLYLATDPLGQLRQFMLVAVRLTRLSVVNLILNQLTLLLETVRDVKQASQEVYIVRDVQNVRMIVMLAL